MPPILPQLSRPRRVIYLAGWLLALALTLALPACGVEQVTPDPSPAASQATATRRPNQATPTRTPRQTPQPSPTVTPHPLLTVEAGELDGMRVQFWHSWAPGQLEALVAQFNRTNTWGVRVDVYAFPHTNALGAALLAAEPDELPQVAAGYPDQLLAWHTPLALVDLAPYAADPTWGLSASQQADFYPLFWAQDTLDGVRLGLPVQRTATFIVYNASWAQELGFSANPLTTSGFKAQACAANLSLRRDATVSNDFQGGWLVSDHPGAMLGWLSAFGGSTVNTATGAYTFDTPAAEQAFAYLKSLIDENCAWVGSAPVPDEPFAARQALFAAATLEDLPFITQAFAAAENPDEWRVLPFPSPRGAPALPVTGVSLALLPAAPAEQLAGWLFMRWLAEPATQAFWVRLSGEFPVRQSAAGLLADYAADHPQWAQALAVLDAGHTEPHLASWEAVQWALADAGTQLFRSYFTPERIPDTLAELERTAAELHELYDIPVVDE